MILRGFGNENTLITRGLGWRQKVIKEIIRIFSKFYSTIFLRSEVHKVENIMLKSSFANNIYLKSTIK